MSLQNLLEKHIRRLSLDTMTQALELRPLLMFNKLWGLGWGQGQGQRQSDVAHAQTAGFNQQQPIN